MKRNLMFTIFLLFNSTTLWALDQHIKILPVYTSTAGSGTQVMKIMDALDYFEDVFQNSDILVPANVASPVPLNISLSGDVIQQYEQAEGAQALIDLRNSNGADLVIVFTSNVIGDCGIAPNEYWINSTIPTVLLANAQGLDLRGKDDSYIALVDVGCSVDVTAHELGHLFGAGHVMAPGESRPYLLDDSHADAQFFNIPPPINILVNYRTIVSDTEAECAN